MARATATRRRSDNAAPPRKKAGLITGVVQERELQETLLEHARRSGNTVTIEDVIVWAHSVQNQVCRGYRGPKTWADAVAEVRAWGMLRGVIRRTQPPERLP